MFDRRSNRELSARYQYFQIRKIIYNAELRLSVADLDKSRTELQALVKKHGGFLAGSEIRGTVKQQRSGYWKVRIPATSFESFRDEVLLLGEVEQNSLQSQDITKEYTDIQSRLKNAKQTEERLKEHLKRDTKKLEDILKVEQEIDRVRQRIEEMEGQIRLWDNLTSLSTIMVYLTERGDYVPLQTASFGTQLGRTFSGSVGALVNFGKGILFVIVGVTPWLPVIAIVVLAVWLGGRRLWRAVA